MIRISLLIIVIAVLVVRCNSSQLSESESEQPEFTTTDPEFEWKVSKHLPYGDGYELSLNGPNQRSTERGDFSPDTVSPENGSFNINELYRAQSAFFALTDPTIISSAGDWHMFFTRRAALTNHSIEYLRFQNIEDEEPRQRTILPFTGNGLRAPQVFFHRPHQLWYLIFQKIVSNAGPQPFFSTTRSIDQPESWGIPERINLPAFENTPDGWGDYWFISDQQFGYLFITSKEGKLYRSETTLQQFPQGWSTPEVCLEGDFLEAGHIYKINEWNRFLAVIVSSRYLKRYHKAYVAEELNGPWEPFAVTRTQAFISRANVDFGSSEPWADSFGHGELIRSGIDERMLVSANNVAMLLPIVLRREMNGKLYREVPWKLPLVELFCARVGIEIKER